MTSQQLLDELVRDLTSVVPRPKSEVRRRIEEYGVKIIEEFHKPKTRRDILEDLMKRNYLECWFLDKEEKDLVHIVFKSK